ncbi:MAG: condensation domain-containing protein [Phormidesmis sp.]
MKPVYQLVSDLRQLDIHLWSEEGQLSYSAPKGMLTSTLLAQLTRRKPEILAFLNQAERSLPSPLPPIPTVSRQDSLPLSFVQQRLWILDQLGDSGAAYNISVAVRLTGPLQITALSQAVQAIQLRHEALRTTFKLEADGPTQVISPVAGASLQIEDWRDLLSQQQAAQLQPFATAEAQQPFNLSQGPLVRFTLLKLARASHVLLLTMHHIISDGWSMGVFFQEMATFYESFTTDVPPALSPLPIQYADFACWQRQQLKGDLLDAQLTYWKQQLAGAPPLLALPTDHPRPSVQRFRGAKIAFTLPPALTAALKTLSQQQGGTLFMTLLAAFQTLLYRYTGQIDIPVGTDIAGRNRTELEGLIGFFVNLLVMRSRVSGRHSFRQLLAQVQAVAFEAYHHQDLPFETLVEALRPERNLSYAPLVQVLFVLQNMPMPTLTHSELTFSPLSVDSGTAKFDLALFMAEAEDSLQGTWQYNTDLFEPATLERISTHFQTLLASIVAQPDAPIDTLAMLTDSERTQQTMNKQHHQASQLKKLRRARRKTHDLAQMSLIKTSLLHPETPLPLVVSPTTEQIHLNEWLKENQAFLDSALLKHGAILFRGFSIASVPKFEQFARGLCPHLRGDYGDLPQEQESRYIYRSTPYPADQTILFHNESSHLHCWPLKQFFFCLQAAQQGGETPIVDCRKIYQRLDPAIREQFQQKKIMYVRNFVEGLDVSWQDFFKTTDRAAVEQLCQQAAIEFEWKSDGTLKTRRLCPAIAKHPKTGDWVFFNQLQLHHVSCLEAAKQASVRSVFEETDLPRNVYYGDGSVIEDAVMAEICEIYREQAVSFTWQIGDVLILDNMLTAHSRNPFVGPRKITVAMGEMIDEASI